MKIAYRSLISTIFIIFCETAYQEKPCQDAGGICEDYSQECFGGKYQRNLCPKQPKEIRCCVPNGSNISSSYQAPDCVDAYGVCQNKSEHCRGKRLEGRCPSADDSVICCVNKTVSLMELINNNCNNTNKIDQSVNLILFNEGRCQVLSEDERNFYQHKRGSTCMGITPKVGYENRNQFQNCTGFFGHPADFVQWCFSHSESNFKETVAEIYRELYFNVCSHLEQPAFYICCDISVHSGPDVAKNLIKELGPVGHDPTDYALRMNDKHRHFYETLGGRLLKGWNNRANNRHMFIDKCYPKSPIEKISTANYSVIVLSVLLAISSGILLGVITRLKWKQRQKRLKLHHLHQEFLSNTTKLFDLKYEIPKHFLQIDYDSLLGEGEFCTVHRGLLKISVDPEEFLPVAVKEMKKNLEICNVRLLLEELKIMIEIGEHRNILSLIGAVTKDLANDELYIITELCELGSIEKLLTSCTETYVNQLISCQSPLKYTPVTVGSAPLKHRAHYKGLSPLTNEMCTSDLLFYACQIANGMDYMSSIDIFHGDLGARNVFITNDNVIKVGDFGLSRRGKTSKSKSNNVPEWLQPYPWMALEVLLGAEFTTKCDVWSFGVLLWEMFTLCDQVPYDNQFNSIQSIVYSLKNRMRLPKPEYASDPIYALMLHCWMENPDERPQFSVCRDTLKNELLQFCPECFLHAERITNGGIDQQNYSEIRNKISAASQAEDAMWKNLKKRKRNFLSNIFLKDSKASRV